MDELQDQPRPVASSSRANGYIFVYQDVRGRYMSEGDFVNMRPHRAAKHGPTDIDESTDTYDTIDWLVKNVPNNNGKVGMWGISYPGFYTAAGMIDAHPALKAASPQAPIADWFIGDDFHHNGALFLPPHASTSSPASASRAPSPPCRPTAVARPFDSRHAGRLRASSSTSGRSPTSTRSIFKNDVAFWNEMTQHATYDEFWQARNLRRHLKNIKPAVMTVGGWFDAEDLFGALDDLQGRRKATAPAPTTSSSWARGGTAAGRAATATRSGACSSAPRPRSSTATNIELPFFKHYLKGKDDPKLPEAYVFETGTNQWRKARRLAAERRPAEDALLPRRRHA